MKVYLSDRAEPKLLRLTEFLLEECGIKARDKFLSKLSDKLKLISSHPNSCPKSRDFEGLYQCVVTKHTSFYYRTIPHKGEIEIITIFDTRQNPDKLSQEY